MERRIDDGRSVWTIVRAVADVRGVDPLELPPLGEHFDADALDRLLAAADEVMVTFDYAGCAVRATPTRVTVRQQGPRVGGR
ncbi:HalOD1 output domain-containing protein [Halopiger aswanensis]|uniref:Halobacterial output domain-containing protein n=1 Tax=Halopiger aswanensis TaxID=148449 RepID=A0A3R7DBU8_9EURY|nr:HalOD1 output domain-containing protein [Halopiger aswanensis]RKD97557.1 hypothetical protein ATJ93_0546 [Halopiger aswanensis]